MNLKLFLPLLELELTIANLIPKQRFTENNLTLACYKALMRFVKTDFRFHKKGKVTKTDCSRISSKDFDFYKVKFTLRSNY